MRERIARNLLTIRIVKELAAEKRPATPEEQRALVRYVGWGGLPRIFEPWKYGEESKDNEFWREQHEALKALLTEAEYARARNSTQNAHYTSPEVIRAMWAAVRRLGATSGSALETSAGIGHFVGLVPADLRSAFTWAMVEKDPLTAQIAAALYPGAFTQNAPFEKAQLPGDHFTLAISNVPFGNIPITDPAFQGPAFVRQRIHNYFFAKALDKVAPGGLVAFITTHGTLDSRKNQQVREYLAGRADFLGAIRLPFTAFKATAGTEVITDIIFLRKRHEGAAPAHVAPWTETRAVPLENKDGQPVEKHVNEYMLDHPEMVLGKHTATGKMRHADAYNVEPTGGLATQLATAIRNLPENAIDLTPPASTLAAFQQTMPPAGSRPFEYLIHEGRLAQILDGKVTPVDDGMSAADQARVTALLPVREALREVYDRMAKDASDAEVQAAQKALTKAYDAFVRKHGYISEDKNWRAFREDPDLPLLLSLEDYDDERETATMTAIFTTRTVRAERQARSADSPQQALQLVLGETGRVDLARAGELLGVTADEAAQQLEAAGLIIDTPSGWQLPAAYLSGNVRVKLVEAEAAAKLDPRYQTAVERLKAVIPEDIPAHKINVRLGAAWVPPEMVSAFIKDLVGNPYDFKWRLAYSRFDAKWTIDGKTSDHNSRYATPDVDTKTLLLAALNDRRITIRTPATKDTPSRVDASATALARQRREELHQAFVEWLFNADPARREWAVRTYNDTFNAHVEPKVDGSYLTFPGMATFWRERIREHQRNAVARVLQFGNTLFAHVVGAGKTLAMIGSGMELRRLGLARKPLYVVPNHLIAQWPSEFLQYYPNAKILIARPEDLERQNRRRFTARIASGDWDAIIMPYSAFVRVSMSVEAESQYHREMLDEIETAIIQAWQDERDAAQAGTTRRGRGRSSGTPPAVKQLENMRDRIQAKLDKLANRPKDDMLSFEQLGVDALLVDEAHSFKNLYFHTRQQAAGIPSDNDAQRATDLYLKVRHVNRLTNYRNVVLATGTPVSNSMAEIFVMQKLLQEQVLKQAGIESFDAWLAQFGLITVEMELDPSGTGLSARARLANYRNLGRLAELFRQVADVKMIDDLPELKAARPKLKGDAPEVIAVESTQEQLAFLDVLKHRADNLNPRERWLDNMAKITVDGRMSALDMRLIDRRRPDNPDSKLNRVAEEVAEVYHEWKEKKGTQLIFMDGGTPGAELRSQADKEFYNPNTGQREKRPPTEEERNRGMDLYADLKKKLVKRGIPAAQIAFIHDVDDVPPKKRDAARKALFRRVKDGQVRVLIGSSNKMGTGMNVQDRLVAEHNVDPTYKPSETEQRYGRILRQGNLFFRADPEFRVRIVNYVTTGVGSKFGFDAYMWQLNESKAKFIANFFKGEVSDATTGLDLDQTVLTATEMKAVATGNPAILELSKLQAEADRLALVRRGYEEQIREARWSKGWAEGRRRTADKEIAAIDSALAVLTPKPDRPTATIGGKEIVGQKEIGEALLEAVQTHTEATKANPGFISKYEHPVRLGTVRGLDLWLRGAEDAGLPVLLLRHPEDQARVYDSAESEHYRPNAVSFVERSFDKDAPGGLQWREPDTVGRIVGQLLARIPKDREFWTDERETVEKRIAALDKILSSEFAQQKELEAVRARVEELQRQFGIGEEQQREQDTLPDDDGGAPAGPSGAASMGGYADVGPGRPAALPLGVSSLRPVEFPELVDLARELINTPEVVKRFRKEGKTGEFQPGRLGAGIRLAADLFKKGNEHELAATLAHEIGHLIDWLPDYTLKRGNILGRLRTLQSFLKGKYTAADGTTISNADVRAELLALSQLWRPWDPETSSASYNAYRKSAKELYADAISVLLNNPGLLEEKAPTFFKEFFDELNNKPDVERAYFDLQEVLSGTREELIARRRAGVRGMFEKGDTQAIELERLRQRERDLSKRDFWFRVRHQLIDKHVGVIDRMRELEQRGVRINPDDDPRYLLEERNYLGGKLKAWLERHVQPVYQGLTEAGIDWHTFGEALLYERITAGDRSEIANPRGLSPAAAEELYNDLKTRLSPEQRTLLADSVTRFRAGVKEVSEAAYDAGLYTDDLHEQMQKNPAYATYRVIEHLEDRVTSRVYKQIGTLKDITNPADATVLKTLVTMRAIEHQRVKVATFDVLTQHFPNDIEQAREVWRGKGYQPIDPPDQRKQQLVTYFDKGKLRGKYVDPYLAESLENVSVGQNFAIVTVLRALNSGVFRPLFTTFNLGFQLFNVGRDFWRFWKNQPTMTLPRAARRYWEAVPLARVRAFGLPEKPTVDQLRAWEDLLEAEASGILSITFADVNRGREPEDTQIEDILVNSGVGGFKAPPRHPLWRPVGAILDTLKHLSDFVETLPKAAGIHEYRGSGSVSDIPPETRSFIRRKLGSPDFLAGGTWKPVTNEVFLFSNAITQAWRADLEVAFGPQTRGGFWWKTAALNLVPKILAMAALYGWFGGDEDDDDLRTTIRRLMRRVSEYDLTNYVVIPIGEQGTNTVYLRLPMDDTGRMVGGLAWKLLRAGLGEREVMETMRQVLDYGSGQFPTVTPTVETLSTSIQYLSGRNPYDAFRGRHLFTDDEHAAGGWQAFKKFIGWEFQTLGGGVVWKFFPGEERPRERTPGQVIVEAPIASNIVGRFIRITNYGETEKLRQAQGEVRQAEAQQRMDERSAINRAIREYQRLPEKERTRFQQRQLATRIAQELYPDDPRERSDRSDTIFKKLAMGIVRGQADPLADAVMSATSTDQRVAMILEAKAGMPAEQYRRWVQTAVQQGVISPAVLAKLRQEEALVGATR